MRAALCVSSRSVAREARMIVESGAAFGIDVSVHEWDSGFKDVPADADAVVSLGGDGTFLRAAQAALRLSVPMLGFNLGRLGFLAEASVADRDSVLSLMASGGLETRERMTVECFSEIGGERAFLGSALNDVVFHGGLDPGLPDISFRIDGMEGASCRADGLIVSTPTGSTAYSLAAGGPIVAPDLDCMILTAISPHTLTSRPLVVSPGSSVAVREDSGKVMTASIDGHSGYEIPPGGGLVVRKMTSGLKVFSVGRDFCGLLREKLGWTGRKGR